MSVLLEVREGPVMRLSLNRPDKRNALSPELIRALLEALATAAKDDSVRSILLTGEGASFCAGGDIDAMLSRRGDAQATHRAQQELFIPLAKAMLHLEKPIVCHVNGDAYGAGLSLVLASDHAITAPNARFAASFVKIGLLPDTGATWLLPKTLGLRAARELALTAEPIDAKRAVELGVVNEIGDQAAAQTRAQKYATMATRAIGLTKRALVLSTSDDLENALAREAALQAALFTTRDHQEGVDAFLQKRAPRFEGR